MSTTPSESSFNFLPQGALIQEFIVARHNIVQSFPDPSQYRDAAFFGETIGRTSNRVPRGEIQSLNGTLVKLPINNGPNHLHGGKSGWGKKTFAGPVPVERNGKPGVFFTYTSPHGDQGYPGTVDLSVWYTAYDAQEDGVSKCVLEVDYEVFFSGNECEETAVGVTNHSYFNLTGSPTIEGTQVTLCTNQHQIIDENQVPTGEIGSYPDIEANKPFTLGPKEPAIDHCFVTDVDPQNVSLDTREGELKKLVTLSHPATKLQLDVFSTEPAFQFYTGEYVDVPATEDCPAKPARAGICIEPSRYINAVNVPAWRGMVLLKRGQTWGAKNIYKAWKT